MKFLFIFLFLIGLLQLSAQSEERLVVRSKAKTLVVTLASFNELLLKHSEKEDIYVLVFNNHTSYKKPNLYEKDGLVEIAVVEEKDYLPGSQQNKYRAGQPLYPDYILEVPENAEVKIVYTKGNFKAHNFIGNLEAYLDHGVVDLVNNKGVVFVQSYGGVINCQLKNTAIHIETGKGSINSEIELQQKNSTQSSLTGIYGDPLNKLTVKTVNAKINLRPLADK